MKKLLFFSFSLFLFFSACKKEDLPDVDNAELRRDGDNNTAPQFDPGKIIFGVRFASGITNEFTGQNLTEVNFHILNSPSRCIVKVYAEGSQNEPGAELYSKDVTASLNPGEWNAHVLDTPIEVTGDDLWLAIEVTHGTALQTVGCDFGPAVPGGDWVFPETETNWLTFRNLTTTESINWNIRGQVE